MIDEELIRTVMRVSEADPCDLEGRMKWRTIIPGSPARLAHSEVRVAVAVEIAQGDHRAARAQTLAGGREQGAYIADRVVSFEAALGTGSTVVVDPVAADFLGLGVDRGVVVVAVLELGPAVAVRIRRGRTPGEED